MNKINLIETVGAIIAMISFCVAFVGNSVFYLKTGAVFYGGIAAASAMCAVVLLYALSKKR